MTFIGLKNLSQLPSATFSKAGSRSPNQERFEQDLVKKCPQSVLKSDFESYIRERSVPFFIYKLLFYKD